MSSHGILWVWSLFIPWFIHSSNTCGVAVYARHCSRARTMTVTRTNAVTSMSLGVICWHSSARIYMPGPGVFLGTRKQTVPRNHNPLGAVLKAWSEVVDARAPLCLEGGSPEMWFSTILAVPCSHSGPVSHLDVWKSLGCLFSSSLHSSHSPPDPHLVPTLESLSQNLLLESCNGDSAGPEGRGCVLVAGRE